MSKIEFQDPALTAFFREEGYVIFPFLNEAERQEALELYRQMEAELPFYNGVHLTYEMSAYAQRKEIAGRIQDLLKNALGRAFRDFQVFQGSFICKSPNSVVNEISLHQDYTFVDEAAGCDSGTLWISLTDSDIEQGAVGVIPKSHRYTEALRFTPYQNCISPFQEQMEQLVPHLKIRPVKAGEAFLWNHATLHGSFPNTSSQPRLTMAVGIAHQDADLRVYYAIPGSPSHEVGVVSLDNDTLVEYNSSQLLATYQAGKIPGDRVPSQVAPYQHRPYTHGEVEAMLQSSGSMPQAETLEYLGALKAMKNAQVVAPLQPATVKPRFFRRLMRWFSS